MTSTRPGPFSLMSWLVAASVAAGCAGDGCSCVSPIPGGFPEDQRVENAVQLRVSSTGLDKLESDPAGLVSGLLGDMGLTFPVPDSCGAENEVCCDNGNPVPDCGPLIIDITPQGPTEQPGQAEARLVIDPVTGANRIRVTLRARISTGSDLPVHVGSLSSDCLIGVDTTASGNDSVTLTLDAVFSQEPWGATRVDFENVALANFDTGDIDISAGDFFCEIANLDFIKDQFVGDFLTSFTENISGMLYEQVCKACPGDTVAECNSPHATACSGDGLCEVSAGRCLQELGITGRMTGDALLGSFSPGTLGAIDIHDVAGGYSATDGEGLSLGLHGGMLPAGSERDRCGPPATPPAGVTIAPSNYFQGNTNPDTSAAFDFAVGVHKHNLDLFAYSGYQGGLMCLNVGTRTVDLLNSETLAVLMPSFIDLLHGKVGQMVLGLRPQAPPTIVLGLGTFDENGGIVEPLLDVTFTGMEIDFYGMVDDQWIRLMTLVADVHLPINLDVDDAGQIVPVLGDLDNAFSNLSVKNSEALLETPAELTDKFPALLELALPLVADGLGGFALPELGGLRLVIPPGGITAVDGKQFLAIFGNLEIVAAAPRVDTAAEITAVAVPERAVYAAARLDRARRPKVALRLGGSGTPGAQLEWSLKVDGGTWSPYTRNPEPVLSRQVFWLPGQHRIEVRAREVGKPWTTDRTPVVLKPVLHPDGQLPARPRPIEFHGQGSGGGCDCATGLAGDGAGGALLLLAAVLLGVSRRARRAAARAGLPLLIAGLAVLAPAGCSCGGTSTECSGPGGECLEGEVERGPLGRWDSIAIDGDRAVVTAYEESLGDLVLIDVSSDTWAYQVIDGVPADVLPVYDPGTYRGGIVEAGPNVGAWTSVTLRDGRVRVAYQDLDQGVLKFAAESDDGWAIHVVDADTQGGSVGLYASLAWGPDGVPAIAYMAAAIDDGASGKKSELRLAVASTATPASESDWTVSVLDDAAVSCAGLCADGFACLPATASTGELCTAVTTDCPAECADDQACIGGTCTAIVPTPAAHDLPGGTGLFARLGYLPDGRAVVVYYDRSVGDLMMQLNETGWSAVPLDAAAGTDTGMHAAMAIDGAGTVHVAYQDALGDRLLYVSWAGGTAGPIEVVDDGTRAGDRTHPVGAGAAVLALGGGPAIAYQDGASSDLLVARRGETVWTREDLLVGATLDGFYTAGATGGRTLISSYRYDRAYWPPGELVVSELP